MKQKEIFAMIFSLFPLLVFAQKDNSKGKPIPSKNKTEFIRNARVVKFSQLDQRKIYQWGNGQRSTPTGRQEENEHLVMLLCMVILLLLFQILIEKNIDPKVYFKKYYFS